MPIIKSAIKRMRQEATRRERNQLVKDELRKRSKAFDRAIDSGKATEASKALSALTSQLDKMVKKNLLTKNTAARRKSAASARVKALGAKPAAKKPAAKKPASKKTPAKKPAAKKD